MQTPREKLGWPDTEFSADGTTSNGSVSVSISSDRRYVTLVPFLPTNKGSPLSINLDGLFKLGDYLQFDSALLSITNRKLIRLSLAFWLDRLLVLVLYLTSNKDQIDANTLDMSLRIYKNNYLRGL